MFYQKRLEQAFESMKKRNGKDRAEAAANMGLDVEKHDVSAMLLAAFITFFPVIIIFGVAVYFILWLFLRSL